MAQSWHPGSLFASSIPPTLAAVRYAASAPPAVTRKRSSGGWLPRPPTIQPPGEKLDAIMVPTPLLPRDPSDAMRLMSCSPVDDDPDVDALTAEVELLHESIKQLRRQILEEREKHEKALAEESAKRERQTNAYRTALAGLRRSFMAQVDELKQAKQAE